MFMISEKVYKHPSVIDSPHGDVGDILYVVLILQCSCFILWRSLFTGVPSREFESIKLFNYNKIIGLFFLLLQIPHGLRSARDSCEQSIRPRTKLKSFPGTKALLFILTKFIRLCLGFRITGSPVE